MIRKYSALLFLALGTTSLAQSAVRNCKLPSDLFDRRNVVAKELNSTIAATRAKPGLSPSERDLQERLETVDRRYHRFMATVSEDAAQHRPNQLNVCCRENAGDPIAREVCGLALYLIKQNTAEEFIEGFPAPDNLQSFWALDEIANVEQTPKSVPTLFAPDGPVSTYITELFKLVEKGDKAALRKYLELYLNADGQYAELMEDQVEYLFSEHPIVVLDNWDSIGKSERLIGDLQDSLSADQKRQMTSQFRRYCYVNASACRDVIAALR